MAKKDFNFILNKKKLPKVQRTIAYRLNESALKHFGRSFDREGFTNQMLEKWTPSRRVLAGGGKTLSDRGDLRRSIRGTQLTNKKIKIISDRPYSHRHNEGTDGSPKRQFIGKSAVLDRLAKKIIIEEMNKIFLR